MTVPALLVSTATRWMGTARIPAALASAGFSVALLTPRSGLAEKSRHLSRISYLPDNATTAQWVTAFREAVELNSPRVVLPCDDMAFRLLAVLARTRPRDMTPAAHARLATLVHESLGDPAHFETSVDKTRLPAAALALGVAVPPHAIVPSVEAAYAFAERQGYPVVLKRAHGFAGAGVAVCNDADALAAAFERFLEPQPLDLGSAPSRCLVQAHVDGVVHYYLATAWQRRLIAGYASEKVVAHPHPTGPPTVTRHFRSPQLRAIANSLVAGLGINGHFFAEFVVPSDAGSPLLLEINRRITPGSHRGSLRNVDHWAALYAALTNTPPRSRADMDEGEGGVIAWFPEEWLRDPESDYLRRHIADVPWDEPALLEALVAMRHER